MIRSDTEIALMMLANGFPANPQVIAEGIGVVHAESGGNDKNNASDTGGAIGLWSLEPGFEGASTSQRLNPFEATHFAHLYYQHGGWGAWAPYETTEAEGTGPSRAPRYIGTAGRAIKAAEKAGRSGGATAGRKNVDFLGGLVEGAESLLEGGLLEQGPKGKALGPSGATSELGEEAVGGVGGILGPIVGPITTIGEVFKGVGELLFTPEGWLRLGKLIGGAILFLWGVDILVKNSTNTDVAGHVGKVAEIAAVVK